MRWVPLTVILVYSVMVSFVLLASLNLLLAMSIDRFVALFLPHQYKYGYQRTKYALVFITIWTCAASSSFLYLSWFRELGTAATYIPMSATVLIYAAIYWGMYVRNRKKIASSGVQQPSQTVSSNYNTHLTTCSRQAQDGISMASVANGEASLNQASDSSAVVTSSENQSNASRQQLFKTAKMFCAITAIFILAYIPYNLINYNIIKFPTGNIYRYTYYLNSISNFFIYFYWNKRFRQNVTKLVTCGKM